MSLSVLAWNPHKGLEGWKWRRGGRSQRRQRETSWQRKAEENSWLEIALQRRTQSSEGGSEKMEAGQSRDEPAFLVALCKFWTKYMPVIACKCMARVGKTSLFLHLELTQVCICSFVLFLYPLGCVLCICKQIPLVRDEKKPLDESLAISSLV